MPARWVPSASASSETVMPSGCAASTRSTRSPRSRVSEEEGEGVITRSVRYLCATHDSRAITGHARDTHDQERDVMAARTGSDYIERLGASHPTILIGG